MKKIILASLLLLALCLPMNILAQNEPSLATVTLNLWPEYDRPSMLVIYHVTLPSTVILPFQMSVRIPTAAGAPHAVAVRQPDNSLLSVPSTQEVENGWTRVVFQATTPEVQLEYYDPGLRKDGETRTYAYIWPGDYSVGSFTVEVQRPASASELSIKPGMVSARQGADGLTYYLMNVGPLSQGQQFDIDLEYQKADDSLSFSEMPVDPSAPLDRTTTGLASMIDILPWLLGFLGLVLIVGGGVWYWNSGREKAGPQRSGRVRRRTKPEPAASGVAEGGNVYCHQCGKRASPGDRFCRACGTTLRIP